MTSQKGKQLVYPSCMIPSWSDVTDSFSVNARPSRFFKSKESVTVIDMNTNSHSHFQSGFKFQLAGSPGQLELTSTFKIKIKKKSDARNSF